MCTFCSMSTSRASPSVAVKAKEHGGIYDNACNCCQVLCTCGDLHIIQNMDSVSGSSSVTVSSKGILLFHLCDMHMLPYSHVLLTIAPFESPGHMLL